MIDNIKAFWDSQAQKYGEGYYASWGDNWMLDLEIKEISNLIADGATVLDVGCANGFSTTEIASRHILNRFVGIDFSEYMVAVAKERISKLPILNIDFQLGDIRSIDFSDRTFDFVYTTRCLINLSTWEEQQRGIKECVRVCKNGGKIIFSEGFWEPLCNLNAIRAVAGLQPLVEHDYNRYLKLSNLRKFLDSLGLVYKEINFSSVYYLGSRFIRELVTDVSAFSGFSNPINDIFHGIEMNYSGGEFGIQKIFIIERPV